MGHTMNERQKRHWELSRQQRARSYQKGHTRNEIRNHLTFLVVHVLVHITDISASKQARLSAILGSERGPEITLAKGAIKVEGSYPCWPPPSHIPSTHRMNQVHYTHTDDMTLTNSWQKQTAHTHHTMGMSARWFVIQKKMTFVCYNLLQNTKFCCP